MEVPRGTIEGVLGRNGAGKSTLLRLLGGVYEPTAGTVTVRGQAAGLFELGGLGNPALTGRAYAERFLRFMRADRRAIVTMIDDIREFSELGPLFESPVRTYSSGMAARLYFATLTAMQHEIYLVDELLSVGDEHFQGRCRERVRSRLLGGASGVLVTHDWTAVLRLCERAHVLEGGKFVYSGPAGEAVIRYLGIPIPPPTRAHLVGHDAGQVFEARSGVDLELEFMAEIEEPVQASLAISIEMLEVGIGWEILILSDWCLVGSTPGRYGVVIRIPRLPIRPGRYALNVFLRDVASDGGSSGGGLDMRSWTVGNGLVLQVDGDAAGTPIILPGTIEIEDA